MTALRVSERGSVTVLAAAALVLTAVLALGVARLGRGVGDRARADTAADAAALAAAGALARSAGDDAARTAAAESAQDNGAVLVTCRCHGAGARVVVAVGDARGRAHAEVRFDCLLETEGC